MRPIGICSEAGGALGWSVVHLALFRVRYLGSWGQQVLCPETWSAESSEVSSDIFARSIRRRISGSSQLFIATENTGTVDLLLS
jgi:hypothetical protein